MRKKKYEFPTIKELVQWRIDNRLTLQEASKLFGMNSYQALWRWEVGFALIPAKRALTVAARTGIPPHILRPDVWDKDTALPGWVTARMADANSAKKRKAAVIAVPEKDKRTIALAAVKTIIPAIEQELNRKFDKLMGLDREPGVIVVGSAAWGEYQV
jgi:hypothetical protein